MKKISVLLLFPLLIISSCTKEQKEICASELCIQYQYVWEDLFKTRNNMTDEYFDKHITIMKTSISSWRSGESFSIDYYTTINWAKIENNDQFIILKSAEAGPFAALNLPVDIYLSKEEINSALDFRAYSSSMANIKAHANLKYKTKALAIEAARKKTPYKNARSGKPFYIADKVNNKASGNPFLTGMGRINKSENRCFETNLDLITGEITYRKTVCWIDL